MLSSLLVFALLLIGIAVTLFAGTLLLQGSLYSEPVNHLFWRGPAAALVLTAFVAVWCYIAYRSPGNYNTIFEFSAATDRDHFDHFWSVKRGRENLYVSKRNSAGRFEYRGKDTNKTWSRSDSEGVVEAVIVEDSDGEKVRFEAELTPDGKFKAAPGEPVRYVEVNGKRRVMTDNDIGNVSIARTGRVFANILLNFLHLIVWFAVLWLLLRFQWSHALGLAVVLWLIMTFAIMPMLFRRAEDAARGVGRTIAWFQAPSRDRFASPKT